MFRHNENQWKFLLITLLNIVSASLDDPRASVGHDPFRIPRHRDKYGVSLEQYGSLVGVELGVQVGKFSSTILKDWKGCTKFYLVDLWQQQEHTMNYADTANVGTKQQIRNFESAREAFRQYSHRTKAIFLPMSTTDAVELIPDASVDFIYVDARHDYCSVKWDIETWWPKLVPGGVMAGHDYLDAAEARILVRGSDWSLCPSGLQHGGAVKGAVQEFAEGKGLEVLTTEVDTPKSWTILKPSARSGRAAESGRGSIDRMNAAVWRQAMPHGDRVLLIPFPVPHLRRQLGLSLERFGGHAGVELGARDGTFVNSILKDWTNCTEFYLVDDWHEPQNLEAARTALRQHRHQTKAIFLPMQTRDAAELVQGPVDFIGLHARNDYHSVAEDMITWWPKLRPGGVMAGHFCEEAVRHEGGLEGAVLDFAEARGLQVLRTEDEWPGWVIQKPSADRGGSPLTQAVSRDRARARMGGLGREMAGNRAVGCEIANATEVPSIEVVLQLLQPESCWYLQEKMCWLPDAPQKFLSKHAELIVDSPDSSTTQNPGAGASSVSVALVFRIFDLETNGVEASDFASWCRWFDLTIDAQLSTPGVQQQEWMGIEGLASLCSACTLVDDPGLGLVVRCSLSVAGLRFGGWHVRVCLWQLRTEPRGMVTCGTVDVSVAATSSLKRVLARVQQRVQLETPGMREEQDVRLGETMLLRFRVVGRGLAELREQLSVELLVNGTCSGVRQGVDVDVASGQEGALPLRLGAGVYNVSLLVAYKERAMLVRSVWRVLRVREWRAEGSREWLRSNDECGNYAVCRAVSDLSLAMQDAGSPWFAAGYSALGLAVWGWLIPTVDSVPDGINAPWLDRFDVGIAAQDFSPALVDAFLSSRLWNVTETWTGFDLTHTLCRVRVTITLVDEFAFQLPPAALAPSLVRVHGLTIHTLGDGYLRHVSWPSLPAEAPCLIPHTFNHTSLGRGIQLFAGGWSDGDSDAVTRGLYYPCEEAEAVVGGDASGTCCSVVQLLRSLDSECATREGSAASGSSSESGSGGLASDTQLPWLPWHPAKMGSDSKFSLLLGHAAVFEGCLEKQREVGGEFHLGTIGTMLLLGDVYYRLGWHGEAEKVFEKCVQVQKQTLPEGHPHIRNAESRLESARRVMGWERK